MTDTDTTAERVMVEAAVAFARNVLPHPWTPSKVDMARLLTVALQARRDHEERQR